MPRDDAITSATSIRHRVEVLTVQNRRALIETYEHISTEALAHISYFARTAQHPFCDFTVPAWLPGFPTFDRKNAGEFLTIRLKSMGFSVVRDTTDPFRIFVCWNGAVGCATPLPYDALQAAASVASFLPAQTSYAQPPPVGGGVRHRRLLSAGSTIAHGSSVAASIKATRDDGGERGRKRRRGVVEEVVPPSDDDEAADEEDGSGVEDSSGDDDDDDDEEDVESETSGRAKRKKRGAGVEPMFEFLYKIANPAKMIARPRGK